MFPFYSLLNVKVIWVYYLHLIIPYKFMSRFLNFPNNLEYVKDDS